jgi:hypothetical protein
MDLTTDELERAVERFAAAEDTEASKEQARRGAIIGIAGRLLMELDSYPDEDLPPEAERLRGWRDDPGDTGLTSSDALPEPLGYEIAQLTLVTAAKSDKLGAAVRAAIKSFESDPQQSFLENMTPYVGISLMMIIAKLGYAQGVWTLDRGTGESLVELVKAMAALTGHSI